MNQNITAAVVGIDVSKNGYAVAVTEGIAGGEVRDWGMIPATNAAVVKFVGKLSKKYLSFRFCFEAGPMG